MSERRAGETRATENVAGKRDGARRIGEGVERFRELPGAERHQNRNYIHQDGANRLTKFRF